MDLARTRENSFGDESLPEVTFTVILYPQLTQII